MITNLTYIVWKIGDFGRIFLILFLVFGGGYWYFFLGRKPGIGTEQLMWVCVSVFLVLCFFMIPLSNPVGHRYFLAVILLLLILVVRVLGHMNKKRWRNLLFVLMLSCLITGNFWTYPERFGNGWDSSLKCLPYFRLYDQMKQYVETYHIDPGQIGTGFPLIAHESDTRLVKRDFAFGDMNIQQMDSCRYVLFSNVCNEFTVSQMQELSKAWLPIVEFHSGQCYLRLYKNPAIGK